MWRVPLQIFLSFEKVAVQESIVTYRNAWSTYQSQNIIQISYYIGQTV